MKQAPLSSLKGIVLLIAFTADLSSQPCGECLADDYSAAVAASKRNDFASAIRLFSKAIEENKNNCHAYWERGMAYQGLRQFDKALADYDETIRLDPTNVLAFVSRASLWHAKGDFDKAIADFNEAIRHDPKEVAARVGRGSARHAKGEFDSAIADFDDAIRLDPMNVPAYLDRGAVWHAKGCLDKALADYDETIRLDPTNSKAYFNRGSAFHAKGDLNKALADYNESIRLNRKFVPARINRSVALARKREFENAAGAEYEEAIRLDKESNGAFVARGDKWRERGLFDKALADYDEALDRNPNSAFAYDGRARIRATCVDDKYRDGAKAVEDATKASQSTLWACYGFLNTLAAAYAETGDFAKAVEWQQKAIHLAPQYAEDNLVSRLKHYQAGRPIRE